MTLNWFLRAFGISSILLSTAVVSAQAPMMSTGKCAQLFGALSDSPTDLKEDLGRLTEAQKLAIERHRVCLEAYGYPAGGEEFAQASAAAIKADKDHFQTLFADYDSLPDSAKRLLSETPDDGDGRLRSFRAFRLGVKDVSADDWKRLVRISQGQDREQALLFGQFMYVKALRNEGDDKRCALIYDEMRRSHKLELKPHRLDRAEQSTYLTSQALRNLIAAEGLAAKASLPSAGLKSDAELAAILLDSLGALSPIFTSNDYVVHVPDPTSKILGRLAVLRHTTPEAGAHDVSGVPAIAGLLNQADATTVFLEGLGGLHAVEISAVGEVSPLQPEDAARRFTAFNHQEVLKYSSDDMTLYNAMRYRDGSAELDFGGELVSLDANEVKQLENGQRLPDIHPLTVALTKDAKAKVMYANVLMQKSGSYLRDGDALTFAIRRSYPEVNIFRDPLSDETNQRVKNLVAFSKTPAHDVTAIVADSSFKPKVDDFNIIKSVEASLTDAGVNVVTYKDATSLATTNASGGNGLIVITAHSNDALARFVEQLGSHGVFEGKYVLFNTCGTPLTRSLADRINTQYKAIATFAYQGRVPVKNMKAALNSLANSLKSGSSFNDAVTNSLKEGELNGVWHVSELQRSGEDTFSSLAFVSNLSVRKAD